MFSTSDPDKDAYNYIFARRVASVSPSDPVYVATQKCVNYVSIQLLSLLEIHCKGSLRKHSNLLYGPLVRFYNF